MNQQLRRVVWPIILFVTSIVLVEVRPKLNELSQPFNILPAAVVSVAYFSAAWLVSRVLALALDQAAARRRPYPRLLKDLIAAMLFVAALAATLTLFMGQGAVGALASSGLILAVLGFAVRNVVADTLSGIALGMEGPFRIGDWVEIDGLARGRVIEIGWRTTRILTRDATYMIVPNSQIALQRITNYSAPKPQYRAQLSVTLDKTIPIQEASEVMIGALRTAKMIQQDPAPDIRILAYSEEGITYAVRYWLTRFDRDVDCRDEIYRSIDDALRRARMISPCGQIERADSDRSADTIALLDTLNVHP